MKARTACLRLSGAAFLIGCASLALTLFTSWNGLPLVIFIFLAIFCFFLSLYAFFYAFFKVSATEVVEGVVFWELLDILF